MRPGSSPASHCQSLFGAEVRHGPDIRCLRSAVNLTFLPSISPPPYEEYAKVIIDEGIKIAETAGGPQAGPVITMFKKALGQPPGRYFAGLK